MYTIWDINFILTCKGQDACRMELLSSQSKRAKRLLKAPPKCRHQEIKR